MQVETKVFYLSKRGRAKVMNELSTFKLFGIKSGGETYAIRAQISKLYGVHDNTLFNNIKKLKEDGLINGMEIRSVAQDRRQRMQEVFTLEETIAIGFRLSSDTAIRLQRYASRLIKEKIQGLEEQKRLLEIELSYAWNKSDAQDLYK